MIMSISDTLAAIIGRMYGSVKINQKTLEGSVGFFMSSIFIVLIFSELNIFIATFSVLVATCAELYSPINDNLFVPISFAVTYILIDAILVSLVTF